MNVGRRFNIYKQKMIHLYIRYLAKLTENVGYDNINWLFRQLNMQETIIRKFHFLAWFADFTERSA